MAFRKKQMLSYQPPMYSGGFDESKILADERGDSLNTMSIQHVDVDTLSKESLPLFTLTDVKNSGQVINGTVSFAPSDPVIANDVQNDIGAYVDRISNNIVDSPIADTEKD